MEPKINRKVLIILLGLILIISIIGIYRSKSVKDKGIFTIATIYDITGARGGLKIYYEYYYRGKRYENYAVGSDYTLNDSGKRYFVQFLMNNPERCIIKNIRVPDSITEVPYDGWKELPIKIEK